MTPSGWHAAAAERDAGHDAMQIEVWEYLLTRPRPANVVRGSLKVEFYPTACVFEYPLQQGSKVLGFVDVCEVWRAVSPKVGSQEVHYVAYEIKPRISSVGAIVRQARATRALASIAGGYPSSQAAAPTCDLVAVVPFDDPKLAMLTSAFPGEVWPWREGKPIEPPT